MRKNIQAVIEAFKAGMDKRGETCSTNGRVVYSYQTPIAVRVGKDIFLNGEKYTKTTTTHQNALRAVFPNAVCWEGPMFRRMLLE